tara:strand:+ start:428 stop:601 length:174 start_codon:yes stop_codon:yes gene_type:complete
MKKFILRRTQVYEIEIEAWSKEHALQLQEDGYFVYHNYDMECIKDEDKIIQVKRKVE